MTSSVSYSTRIVNQNKKPTLLHGRADVMTRYVSPCKFVHDKILYTQLLLHLKRELLKTLYDCLFHQNVVGWETYVSSVKVNL